MKKLLNFIPGFSLEKINIDPVVRNYVPKNLRVANPKNRMGTPKK